MRTVGTPVTAARFHMLRTLSSLLLSLAFALPLAAADGKAHLDIKEWPIPWPDSQPHDPHAVSANAVWFVAEKGNYLASLNPQTGRFSKIELMDEPAPTGLIVAANGMLWYTANARGYLGRYDLKTRTIYRAPLTDAVSDPTALTFEAGERNIWFTASKDNIVGRYRVVNGIADLQRLPTPNAAPGAITVAPNAGPPWVALAGTNSLASVDPRTFALTVKALPRPAARADRLAFTSDGKLWYIDSAAGVLGMATPGTQDAAREWPLPDGKDSKPAALAVDAKGRLWIAESGPKPAKLVGFDPKTTKFFGESALPTPGGAAVDINFDAATGGLWFATTGNTIGFAKIE